MSIISINYTHLCNVRNKILQKPSSMQKSNYVVTNKSKKVAIIGGGPAGLICARELLKERHKICIYEKTHDIGGVWRYENIKINYLKNDVHSSMYKNLRTNLPREIMGVPDFPFDNNFEGSIDHRRYCGHEEVYRYIKAFMYEYDLYKYIKFESEVNNINLIKNGNELKYEVEYNNEKEIYDSISVCNGHFFEPVIPKIENIEKFKGNQIHSHWYRDNNGYKNKKIVIWGNQSSGHDIARDIAEVADNVYICGRNWPSKTDFNKNYGKKRNIKYKRNIIQIKNTNDILLEDKEVINDVDILMYCTGYYYKFPFFDKKDNIINTDDGSVYPLYKQIFPPEYTPNIAFIGIPTSILPFPIFYYQSVYYARALSGKIKMPSIIDMNKDIDDHYKRIKEFGLDANIIHKLSTSQYDYCKELRELSGQEGIDDIESWRIDMHKYLRNRKFEHLDTFKDDWDDFNLQKEAEEYFKKIRQKSIIK